MLPSAEPHCKSNTSSNAKAGGRRNSGDRPAFQTAYRPVISVSYRRPPRKEPPASPPAAAEGASAKAAATAAASPEGPSAETAPGPSGTPEGASAEHSSPAAAEADPAECSAGGRPARWVWRSGGRGGSGPPGPSPEDGVVQHRGPPHAGPQIPPAVASVPDSVQDHPQCTSSTTSSTTTPLTRDPTGRRHIAVGLRIVYPLPLE